MTESHPGKPPDMLSLAFDSFHAAQPFRRSFTDGAARRKGGDTGVRVMRFPRSTPFSRVPPPYLKLPRSVQRQLQLLHAAPTNAQQPGSPVTEAAMDVRKV